METEPNPEVLSVSSLHQLINQTLEFAYPEVVVEGEVASFKISQGKWVFFDLKDDQTTLGCFMPVYQLKTPLEDGMLVRVSCRPNLTKWGKFSLTIRNLELAGEGSVKKAFELLKAQFEKEGLFATERKRLLPQYPRNIALITSKQAAAFNDFVTVLNSRFVGIHIAQAQVQVQGNEAPDQITAAIEYFNASADNYDVLVIIRGGGSAEDLQAFNTEPVVRAVYGSKIPTLVGIGHEDDVSLAELAADVRAATPTDAARRVVPEQEHIVASINSQINSAKLKLQARVQAHLQSLSQFYHSYTHMLQDQRSQLNELIVRSTHGIAQMQTNAHQKLLYSIRMLASLDPHAVLKRGYSIARANGKVITSAAAVSPTDRVMLQLHQGTLALTRVGRSKPKSKRISNDNHQTKFRL